MIGRCWKQSQRALVLLLLSKIADFSWLCVPKKADSAILVQQHHPIRTGSPAVRSFRRGQPRQRRVPNVKRKPRQGDSNTEPKQPNSEHSSLTHRVRRRKRVNSAISSRPTRRLPKTKSGWQFISIRRFNGERIARTVLLSLRKKSKF